jgi:hypothetical protein
MAMPTAIERRGTRSSADFRAHGFDSVLIRDRRRIRTGGKELGHRSYLWAPQTQQPQRTYRANVRRAPLGREGRGRKTVNAIRPI